MLAPPRGSASRGSWPRAGARGAGTMPPMTARVLGPGKLDYRAHWSSLAGAVPQPLCSGGSIGRYCCDPRAWANVEEDFGDRAYGGGGYFAFFGEPVDELLCQLAAANALDPHAVWDHEFMNYKPHKRWWPAHVAQVVAVMVDARAQLAVARLLPRQHADVLRALEELAGVPGRDA